MSDALVDAEVNTMTPIIVNACFAALYAKLRTIHKDVHTYANRFEPPPICTRDIELPLPLADAIQNIGVFTPSGTVQNYLCIPVYPENVLNEGRSTVIWEAYHYEAYVPQLKTLGIPVKSVDTRLKIDSSWWTYKVELHHVHYGLLCIFSPSNYSDHSCNACKHVSWHYWLAAHSLCLSSLTFKMTRLTTRCGVDRSRMGTGPELMQLCVTLHAMSGAVLDTFTNLS